MLLVWNAAWMTTLDLLAVALEFHALLNPKAMLE
jgi:hypothetical protein